MADPNFLFKPPLILANNEGRKSQTRRILKNVGALDIVTKANDGTFHVTASDGSHASPVKIQAKVCDLVWVKETWRPFDGYSNWDVIIKYFADGVEKHFADGEYNSDWIFPKAARNGNVPSIFMPKWASRTTLKIADVRVQRLQDISEEDAVAEGVEVDEETGAYWGIEGSGVSGATPRYATAKVAYQHLWNSINEPRGYGWDNNPWVAAYTYETIQTNILEMT